MIKKLLSVIMIIAVIVFSALPCAAVGESSTVLEINRESINLYPSQTYRLTVTNTSDTVYFSSANEKVATVGDDGIVTAVSAGTTEISAMLLDGNEVRCTVNVKSGASPQDITINAQSVTLTQGSTKILTATVYPKDVVDNEVFYYSSDTDVASVDSEGTIKALKPGIAVITAESASSSISKKCIVKVVSKTGQGTFEAKINGTLYTIAGEKKDKAIVEIKNGKLSLTETTDSDGHFEFEDVPQGNYILSFYKNKDAQKAAAYAELNVNSYTVNISCIINESELVILFMDSAESGDIKDITLEKSSLILDIGESYDMTYSVRPSTAGTPVLVGNSSNEKVATVDSQGRIVAVAEGKASIMFSTQDGKITKTCVVTVTSVNSNTYSWAIILGETLIVFFGLMIFSIMYRRFLRKKEGI